jgi:hypothetical protein
MEDGGVDTTVIESRQHKMGRKAGIPPLLKVSKNQMILGRHPFSQNATKLF